MLRTHWECPRAETRYWAPLYTWGLTGMRCIRPLLRRPDISAVPARLNPCRASRPMTLLKRTVIGLPLR